MKLSRKKNVDSFLDQLAAEGQHVTQLGGSKAVTHVPRINQEAVHIRLEEKVTAIIGRYGELQKFSAAGFVHLHVNDKSSTKIQIKMNNNDTRGVQLQTHPSIDKKQWQSQAIIGLKNPEKPFPISQDVGVLRWSIQQQDQDFLPIKIVCWPNATRSGTCDVNVEYDLQFPDLELFDVSITIPVPSGCGAPVVGNCDGAYKYDSRKNLLVWSLPVIDKNNKEGNLEFSMPSNEEEFFPVEIDFHSTKKLYTPISVQSVQNLDTDGPAKYSTEVGLVVEKYTIGGDK